MESVIVAILVVAGIVLWTRVSSLRQTLDRVERELNALKSRSPEPVVPAAAPGVSASPAAPAATSWPVPSSAQALRELREVAPPPAVAPPARPPATRAPSMYDRIENAVRGYFTGGNLVVRTGIIVLFFGVGFLLKYAAEHTNISIQVRLTGVALGAGALFVVGWRVRHRRRGFSLALQGGAIGVLYLTLFAALHLYQLLPASLTFALMAGLGVASCLLAVKQDSLAFSLLGATGGFLAPLLAATGSGSHVMLFSYYALLDAFIVAQAWFKAWRSLNLLAFVFTFGIGAFWGVTAYDATQFPTTEPFLLFFLLAFVAIAVLFAFRRAPQLTHYVDGTLVFGTPLIAAALQMHLVRDFTHGRAISALGAGLLYLALAAWLHRRRETLRLLTESFLALGVAFLTLAVPLWFDDVWTAATWALEGAALFWVGLRQQRRLASAFGVLLQLAAAVAYLGQVSGAVVHWPVANAQCVGALLLGAAGLFSSRAAMRPGAMLQPYGQMPANVLLAWGLAWWLYAGHHEIDTFVFHAWQPGALLGLYAFTALVCGAVVLPLNWPALRVPALLILPVMLVTAYWWSDLQLHPSSSGGWLVWPASLAVLWVNLRWHEASLQDRSMAVLHGVAVWLLGLLVSWELGWRVAQFTAPGTVWAGAAWALPATLLVAVLTSERAAQWWPLRSYPLDFRGWVALGLAMELVVWALWLNKVSDGAAAPLPYLPFLNPLDIATALALWMVARWLQRVWREGTTSFSREMQQWLIGALVAVVFCWLNAVLFRTMHYWRGTPYRLHDLLSDTAVQAALSIFWSLLALGAMLWANRSGQRVVWFGAAALMAVVVVKLFLVDLAHIGTIPRIVSFLVVGGLMLVIGYFSPLPPAAHLDAARRPR